MSDSTANHSIASQATDSHQYDVVLIGSGIASLTCAAILAKKGHSVCVLEQYNKPGGYMHCFSRFGARFDTGAHYIGAMDPGQPFHTLLTYLGVHDEELFIELDQDGFDVFKFPNFEIEFPKSYPRLINRLSELFPSDAEGIRNYFAAVQAVVKEFPTYEFNDEHANTSALLKAAETSLATMVTTHVKHPQLISILYSYCTLHGVLPEEVAFGMNSILTDSLIRGAYGFKKGGDALAQKFCEVIRAKGGKILYKKRVTQIETSNGIAQAVITDQGERYEAKWIISGAHPKNTLDWVDAPEIFSPAFRERMKNLKESVGIFGIYGMISKNSKFNPLKNYYYFDSAEPSKILDIHVKPKVAFLCPSDRISNSNETMPVSIHAPAEFEWFMEWKDSLFGKRPLHYKNRKREFAAEMVQFIEKYQPNFSSHLGQFETSSPITNLHFNGTAEGSSYGIYHSIQNTGARSLGPRTKIANLLLTGQNTLFPGLLGAAISGLRTTGHITGIKPLLKELKELAAHG
jgi:all-trans-retinol 13,14-reductase